MSLPVDPPLDPPLDPPVDPPVEPPESRLLNALVTALLRLFPTGFRRRFGADMRHQIQKDHARARTRGRLHGAAFTLATAADLVRTAAAERIDPTWDPTHDIDTTESEGVGMMMSEWIKDLRHAVRSLLRSPGYLALTAGTLGLAIGANAGIFTVVDGVLLDPLPFPDEGRLVYIGASAPGSDLPEEFGLAAEFYVEYAEQSQLLEALAGFGTFTNTARVGDRTERIPMSSPTPSLYATLGVRPALGRLPTEEDGDRVVVISHQMWDGWFGSDPNVIGQTHYLGGADRTVIGVMGPDFWFPGDEILLWINSPIQETGIRPGRFGMPMVARLAPGATIEGLSEELTRLAQRLPERYDASADYVDIIQRFRPVIRPARDQILGDISRPLRVLMGSVAVVLLIACANVANLFMVRSEDRARELAVRRALGAGRGRLIRSRMAEAVVIAGVAGVLAVALAWVGVPLLLRAAPADVPRLSEVHLGATTLLFTFGACVLSALLCGLLPAIRASAPRMGALRDGGRGSTRRAGWTRDALVIGQTALALVLLIGSGLLVRSSIALKNVDAGYDTEDVFTFQFAPEAEHLVDGPSWAAFHMDFMDRIRALPGVETVGIVENVPLNEGVSSQRFVTDAMPASEEGGALAGLTFSGGDYYEAMGIDVVAGRPFRDADHVSELGNAVISASAARLFWPGEEAVGRRLRVQEMESWATVVGVVEDVMQSGFRDTPEPLVYLPLQGPAPSPWRLSSPGYVVKTARADVIAPEIREMVREVAPGAPMYRIFTMAGLARDSMMELSFTMLTLGVASGLALLLGAIGLFGILSYTVVQRTQEIGVRMALGAEARKVQGMIVRQGLRVVIVGVVLGLAAGLASTRVLGTLLFGVEAVDAGTFVGMAALMILVGLFASWLPARRASGVDPIESLKGA